MARQQGEECGCAHKDGRWIKFCDAHKVEHEATSARWAADYDRTVRNNPDWERGNQGRTRSS